MSYSGLTPVPAMAGTDSGMDWIPILAGFAVILAILLIYLFARGKASAEARGGLILGLRGLLGKEFRSRSRGWRPVWLLTGYLGALTLAVVGFQALISKAGGTIQPNIGTQLFSGLSAGLVLLLAFITPALTVGAIAGERERRTLDLLLVTRSSALGLAAGKLLGSVFYVLFLLAASLPAFALVYLFGGVPPIYLAMVLAVAAITAVAFAALGLALSALLKRTLVATVVAYLLVLFITLGLPFLSAVATLTPQMRGGQPQLPGRPSVIAYASPMASLASVLPSGSNWGMPLAGDVMQLFLGGGRYRTAASLPTTLGSTISLRSSYVVAMDPATGRVETGTTWAPWVYHFLLSGALTLLCLLVTAVALAPVKPWQRRRRVMSQTSHES